MDDLKSMHCVAPKMGGPPLSQSEIEDYYVQTPDWDIIDSGSVMKLVRQFKFNNFLEALSFTNKIGEMAEREDHHPAILTEWGKVTITWWTHAVNGLHLNDFIAAAKSDELYLS
ncbi:MAG: 4a-hydroxytetrahydrobiopterin dehydratase [Chloroflexota bacterium]|nr:MAG: 4a-hydroxytetrahydrobiopterin dehydratase [Chloroflexota bacterium]